MKSGSNKRSNSNDSIKTSEVLHESVTKQATNKPKTTDATLCIRERGSKPAWGKRSFRKSSIFFMPFASQLIVKLLFHNGDGEIRTLDPLLARQVLSQLSYAPLVKVLLFSIVFSFRMGLNGLEPSTSRLSGVRSNQLSYKPIFFFNLAATRSPMPSPA